MRHHRDVLFVVSIAGMLALGAANARAHKPVTSQYTYNEDAFPVFRDRCGRCHMENGVAPMSLLTYADTLPWAESIRVELLAGHMPPWRVEGLPDKFRNASALTPRDLDVLLTWVTGGTPIGDPEKTPARVEPAQTWELGTPDLVLQLPAVTLPVSLREDTREFTIPLETHLPRSLRAVDLMPGTPAIVRSAAVSVRIASSSAASGDIGERLLGLWQPGDESVALDTGMEFRLPGAATLVVRVHYSKTWRDQQRAMSDQSTIGLYFASGSTKEVRALTLAPTQGRDAGRIEESRPTDLLTFKQTVDEDLQALAMFPDPMFPRARVRVTAVKPNGTQADLIIVRLRPGWARRYWFSKPFDLPRGTVLEVTTQPDDVLLAPDAPRIPQLPLDPSVTRLTIDVVSR